MVIAPILPICIFNKALFMKKFFLVTLGIFFTCAAFSQVVQWRGPKRDGYFNESGLLKSWTTEGPQMILKEIGRAHV